MKSILITEAQSKALLKFLDTYPAPADSADYLPHKHQLVFDREEARQLTFRLPFSIHSPKQPSLLSDDRTNYVLIMIRSGIASVGYFENGENIDHKVFRAYMVRKKQGMSQLKYLKTKGKSRAGSRVRLAETQEFFEQIAARLNDYFQHYHIDRIGLSCPVTLVPHFYGAQPSVPFSKADPRIVKIPKHIQNPTYESLMNINAYLLKGEIKWQEEAAPLLDSFLAAINPQKNQPPDEDDW